MTWLVPDHISAPLVVGLLVATGLIWQVASQLLRYHSFPLLKNNYYGRRDIFIANRADVYQQSYDLARDDFHRIPTPDDEHIIIPHRYLDELRDRGDDEIDVLKAFKKVLENRYLGLFPSHRNTHVLNGTVKKELTKALVRINPMLSKAVDQTVASILPSGEDWTRVKINKELMRIVAIVSGHVFIGPELCMEEEYLQVSVDFALHMAQAAPALKTWHPLLRPLANYIEAAPIALRADRAKMLSFLTPVINKRRAAKSKGEVMPDDFLQWLLENTDAAGITGIRDITDMMLLLIMAAIHTTTLSATFAIYDLVYRPDAVEDCRREIKEVLRISGGVMTTKALFDMKLMDSVMKESQRLNPPFLESFRRVTLKPITLKDGTVIPSGSLIETPSKPVLMDPAIYPNAEKFDPYRFFKLRTTDESDPMAYKNREQYQFVSVTKENMSFGFGRHACPGRFFAANEIKLILSQILLHYEIKLPEDVGDDVRGLLPDANREILFRKII